MTRRTDQYKAQLDAFLIGWAMRNPGRVFGSWGPFSWLSAGITPATVRETEKPPGAYRIPLYRMRAMPAPFKSYKDPEP